MTTPRLPRHRLNWSHYADRLRAKNRERLVEQMDEDRQYDLWIRLANGNGRSQVWRLHDWRLQRRAQIRRSRRDIALRSSDGDPA